MRGYLAKTRGKQHAGGYQDCLRWGVDLVRHNPSIVVQIYVARAGEPTGKVIAEVTDNCIRPVENGRHVAAW